MRNIQSASHANQLLGSSFNNRSVATLLAALSTLAGCGNHGQNGIQGTAVSPPDDSRLSFPLPTAEQLQASIQGTFKGTAPKSEEEIKTYAEFLRLAATHPIKDWSFSERSNAFCGYGQTAWGGRAYALQLGQRRWEVHEEVELGYDGRLEAATAIMVLDAPEGVTLPASGVGGQLALYCNDDWAALPYKILEERKDLAEKRLSWRTPFVESPIRPEAWSMPSPHIPSPPQPAPLKLATFDDLSPSFGQGWKGRAPTLESNKWAYIQGLNLAAILPIAQWKFEQSISVGFGKVSEVWGYRTYKTELDLSSHDDKMPDSVVKRTFTLREEVVHTGKHLESHCTFTGVDTLLGGAAKESFQVDGGWAELPCQYLETRYLLTNEMLPRRIPFITTPTTPGAFVKP